MKMSNVQKEVLLTVAAKREILVHANYSMMRTLNAMQKKGLIDYVYCGKGMAGVVLTEKGADAARLLSI